VANNLVVVEHDKYQKFGFNQKALHSVFRYYNRIFTKSTAVHKTAHSLGATPAHQMEIRIFVVVVVGCYILLIEQFCYFCTLPNKKKPKKVIP